MTALMFMGVQRETFRCRVYGDDEIEDDRKRPCPDCWGTGKLGRARAMEAALSERTPAPERMAE